MTMMLVAWICLDWWSCPNDDDYNDDETFAAATDVDDDVYVDAKALADYDVSHNKHVDAWRLPCLVSNMHVSVLP